MSVATRSIIWMTNAPVKTTTPLREGVDGKITCQRWTDTDKTEYRPEWPRLSINNANFLNNYQLQKVTIKRTATSTCTASAYIEMATESRIHPPTFITELSFKVEF